MLAKSYVCKFLTTDLSTKENNSRPVDDNNLKISDKIQFLAKGFILKVLI